jgi:hypothetical protein
MFLFDHGACLAPFAAEEKDRRDQRSATPSILANGYKLHRFHRRLWFGLQRASDFTAETHYKTNGQFQVRYE